MSVTVGIPRALLYYYYYPQWETFFNRLGVKTLVSRETTRGLLEKGLKSTVDEACLPVKLAVGHVLDLKDRVDYIFLPRIVSTARREYICPKFLGFPDMVRNNIDNLPPLLDYKMDLYRKGSSMYNLFYAVGRYFTRNPARIYMAYQASLKSLHSHYRDMEAGQLPVETGDKHNRKECDVTIAVIGHPYNIYDRYISMNMLKRLRDYGARVVTADNLPEYVLRAEAEKLPKQLFWTLNQRMVGAAFYYFNRPEVDGLIHVASFGCGPDSMTGELIERFARRCSRKPLLSLTIDEHTGEAGMVTRLEAFMDMVRWRLNLDNVAASL
ncbi:acyl-CoA dehydratase activase-related protein [Desulfallas thermosapovorans]|uniref:Putative nucleotide-binding protein (Sugar kinase/HSP70/actin superfamily) n=1 Tax=Desulfallas thermosapovorans DSM 6562 TaxID=1121431 RepID=A0A5S4ZRW5_9FIRM|nr:acyl-CoA dehydratase activase-related protein [Desulfallas thermosapovorans]TYO95586.1 putative nucleotide-binding protein (sugar kinase/HSP70/actin superfamily) [Desulfallas thermosapovorans DSM 6562]